MDKARETELIKKYSDGKASDDEIRELFKSRGESEEQIQHRIDIERDKVEPGAIV